MIDWTDERIATLTKLWLSGASGTEVGKALGVSRNSVIGKAHRMGLQKSGVSKRKVAPPKPRRKFTSQPPTPVQPRPTPKYCKPKPLIELKDDDCRYAVNSAREGHGESHLFCSQPIERKAYCLYHYAVVYREQPNVRPQ